MKTMSVNMVELTREEFDRILRKPDNYLFFVKDEVVVDGVASDKWVMYKGSRPLIGSQGAGIDFQTDGTRIRFGRIPPGGGETVWEEWIDIRGEQGEQGEPPKIIGFDFSLRPSLLHIDTAENNKIVESEKYDGLYVKVQTLLSDGTREDIGNDDTAKMRLFATYYNEGGNKGSRTDVYELVVSPAQTGEMRIPLQVQVNGNNTTRIALELQDLRGEKLYASKDVPHAKKVVSIIPEVSESGVVSWKKEENDGSATLPSPVKVVPEISEDTGNWSVAGKDTGIKANWAKEVSEMQSYAQSASDSAQVATTAAQEAKNEIKTISGKVDEAVSVAEEVSTLSNNVKEITASLQGTAESISSLNNAVANINKNNSEVNNGILGINNKLTEQAQAISSAQNAASEALKKADGARTVRSYVLKSEAQTYALSQGGDRVLSTGVCYSTAGFFGISSGDEEALQEKLETLNETDCLFFKISGSSTPGYDSFCLGQTLVVKDRWFTYMIQNVSEGDSANISFTFAGYDNLFTNGESVKLPPGAYVELRYLNDTKTGRIYAIFSEPIVKLQEQ